MDKLSYNDKLDALADTLNGLIEQVAALADALTLLSEGQDEILEKLSNVSTRGSGYEIGEFGEE